MAMKDMSLPHHCNLLVDAAAKLPNKSGAGILKQVIYCQKEYGECMKLTLCRTRTAAILRNNVGSADHQSR